MVSKCVPLRTFHMPCSTFTKTHFFVLLLLAVVIDEGHIMLKNNKSGISKALSSIKTPRRIALTGTPLQNNLIEYYRMAEWIRPGCLGTEAEFEKKYVSKIMTSLTVSSNILLDLLLSMFSICSHHSFHSQSPTPPRKPNRAERGDLRSYLKFCLPLFNALTHLYLRRNFLICNKQSFM